MPIGLYVGVALTREDAFAPVNRASIAGFTIITAGLLLGLVMAWLGAQRFISRPIGKLMAAASQWSRGNFGARADVGKGSSELAELGRTFDSMAALLQRQQEDNAVLLASLENRVEERTHTLALAQAELAARADELEAKNRDLSSEMRRREQAEEVLRHVQKIDALGQLTGGIAHDFNNILHVILGNLKIVERRLNVGESDARSLGRPIQFATRAAEQAAALIRKLLAFGRRQPLDPKPLDVNKLITGMSDMLHRTLGEAIDLEIVLGARLWQTLADANELENAILNLAVNSRDAMPAGGKLTIETTNSYLDETYALTEESVQPGQYLLIAVTDTGKGMSPATIEKAFDPFFTTKETGHGTGLGLSQVYGFIKQSGGHIKIYSEEGNGTTIKLYLPRLVASPEVVEEKLIPDAAPARGHAEVVLVVEDHTDARNLAIDGLRELGYEVIDAADGQAALRAIASRPDISLLFTDVGLPGGLDGRQLAEQARQRRPDLKVLYTTGYARNAIVHQGRLDPGVELIVKPFTHAEFAARIRDVLGR
ncbi:MAG: response regulator [Alphaproteobacteria bacterium]|nr:response regulator [Alphaproteobacteria bacterium]